MELDKKQILEYQQNRDPYLLIDHATEVLPGKSAKGYKILKNDEWFFKVHWPNDPNMPGMLQVEALVQMCALSILTLPKNKGKVVYLVKANNLKFIKKIVPNSKFEINTKILSCLVMSSFSLSRTNSSTFFSPGRGPTKLMGISKSGS